jgi:spore maturation protein CgeB
MPKVEGLYYLYAISGTKIGIHVNAANNVSMYHSDRLTHYLAGGAFVLCKYVPNSELLFKNNEHLIYFHTADELEQLIDYYLKNEKERQRIADAGMKYVHQEYNSIKIGKYILEIVEQGTCKAPWKVNQS